MHWAANYIGLPWEATAEGPHAFYCWSFMRHVQRLHYDRALPFIKNPEGVRDIARAFRDHPELDRWKRTERPGDGGGVLMRQSRHPIHVGVWLDVDAKGTECGILHCSRDSGVVFQDELALRQHGWRIEGFYRFQGDEET